MFYHKAKKSMGQNFLKSKSALNSIISAGEIKKDDVILEIGPGKGILTEKLLILAGKVIAVEKDRELVEFLKEKFKEEIKNNKLELIEGNILDYKIQETRKSGRRNGSNRPISLFPEFRYKLIANIPYNITGEILRKFLESDYQPERMVLLLQKEVAKRIVASDGKESILSISVKAYGTPKYIEKIPKRFFSPEPKVDSAILAITEISKKRFKNSEKYFLKGGDPPTKEGLNSHKSSFSEFLFFKIVKAGFAHKRKVLRSNLKGIVPEETLLKFDPNIRAEDLTLEDWFYTAREL